MTLFLILPIAATYLTLSEVADIGVLILRGKTSNLPSGGVRLQAFNRDVIMPDDIKNIMNKVTEARKSAEVNLICVVRNLLPCGLRPTRSSYWQTTRP